MKKIILCALMVVVITGCECKKQEGWITTKITTMVDVDGFDEVNLQLHECVISLEHKTRLLNKVMRNSDTDPLVYDKVTEDIEEEEDYGW